MDTLTPLHDELDLALEIILDRIDTLSREAQWRLEDMYWEKDAWPHLPRLSIDPTLRPWQEQVKLWERYREGKGINYAFPGSSHRGGGAIDFVLIDEIAPQRLSDLLSGHAFDRVLGNEPWLFEFTPPKLPWWKRNALYRAFKKYRFARGYGASKKKALGIRLWPRRSGKGKR